MKKKSVCKQSFFSSPPLKPDMRMIGVLFMILVLVVHCSKRDENMLVKMEIEREIALLRFAADENSEDVRKKLLIAGTKLHRKGMIRDSIRFYNTVLVMNPNYPDALHLKGSAMFSLGYRERGSRSVKRAISTSSSARYSSRYWNTYAEMLRTQGQVEESVLAYDRALEFTDSQMIFRNRGLCEEERKHSKPSDAREYYLKALNASSSFTRHRETLLFSDISRTYLQEARYDKALRYAEEAFRQSRGRNKKIAFMYGVILCLTKSCEIYYVRITMHMLCL